jgi:hypothetical protein
MMNKLLKNTGHAVAVALITVAASQAALAQQAPKGGAIVTSEPGKASAVAAAEVSAQVVGLDRATRTVTLKGPKGDAVDVVAGPEVKNFDQIKVGDLVVVRYAMALTLELRKVGGGSSDITVKDAAARAKPGERPAVAGARQISLIADVVEVDPKGSTITLRGPRGNAVKLAVQNPDQFKVVKVGDKVDVTYTEAVALSVEPAPKAAAPAKK